MHTRLRRYEQEAQLLAQGVKSRVLIGRAGVWLAVKPSSDTKCIRCRQRRPDVGRYVEHPELCGRCVANVDGPGEQRKYV